MAGKLRYIEIAAEDAERAHGFWSGLFGWRFNATPGELPYSMAEGDGFGIGLYRSDDPAIWAYFHVDDLEASARQVEELGGRVADKGPVPGVGWYARCTDTEGNRFGLFQTDEGAE